MTESRSWKIGYLPREGFEHWPIEDICRQLSAIGYRAVEWSRVTHFKPRQQSQAELKSLATIPADFGLEVCNIHTELDYVITDEARRRDNIELTKLCIEAAADIGVHTVGITPGPQRWLPNHVRIPEDVSEGAAWAMVFEAMDEILQTATARRVHLAFEAAWGMIAHDYYTTLPLLARFPGEYLGINMDPSHGTLCRNDIPWVVQQLGRRIRHCHLKDAVGLPGRDGDTFIFPLLGEGLVDWKAFFIAMHQIGYTGTYSVEFESFNYARRILNNDMLAAARLSWDCVQRLLASVDSP
jgi:sugar phosphate isomerase/epimerase